jgi:hypothetical protein
MEEEKKGEIEGQTTNHQSVNDNNVVSVEPVAQAETAPVQEPVMPDSAAALVDTPAEPVSNQVNETSVAPAEPVQPTDEPKKKSKLPIILLIIVLLAAVGFAVWFFVLGGNGNKSNNDKKDEPQKEEKKEDKKDEKTSVDVSSTEVTTAMKNFNYLKINSDDLTKNGKYNVTSLTLNQRIETLGLIASDKNHSLIAYCGNDITSEITIDEMNNILKTIIDYQFTKEELDGAAKDTTITTLNNSTAGKMIEGNGEFTIYVMNGKYYLHSNNCDGSGINQVNYKKTVSAEKDNENLYVYEKRAFYTIDDNPINAGEEIPKYNVKYYKDYDKTELVETLVGNLVPSVNSYVEQKTELTWDSYSTYKYTFKIKDNNYYFDSFELVK